jgi:RimJ/RimL family protein N-acetyltransferase
MDVNLTGHGVEQFSAGRLVGRRLLPADLDFLVDLHTDDEVMADRGGVRSAVSTEPFVQANVAHWRRFQFGMYILAMAGRPDEPIGRAGLRSNRDGDVPSNDVSVMLTRGAWGAGLATEAFTAVTVIGLHLGLKLTATAAARHASARRVMEKTGYVYSADFEHHSRGWVRYMWPVHREAPGFVHTATIEG